MDDTSPSLRRIAKGIGVALLVVLGAVVLVLTARLWLLVFAAVMIAIVLRSMSEWLSARTPLPQGLSLFLVMLLVFAVTVGGGVVLVADASEAAEQLGQKLPDLLEELGPVGEWAQAWIEDPEQEGILAAVGDALTVSLSTIVYLLVVGFLSLYMAAQPDLYLDGTVRLVPQQHRARAREVLLEMGANVRRFVMGRLVSMAAVGVLSGVGLALLGVPMAGLLGAVAGVLTFVPYAGPVAASVPIVLVALIESPVLALGALAWYTFVQATEGFVITPLVQQRAAHLPPAITLGSEVFMGLLFGLVGVVLSVPLAAAALVFVEKVYVEDVLEDR